jgi:hypothetical protein
MTDDEKDGWEPAKISRKRQRPLTPATERTMVSTRFEPVIYEKVAQAAAANRRSMSSEIERLVTEHFTSGSSELGVLRQQMETALTAGLRFGNPDQPIPELLKDHFAFDLGTVRVVEALLGEHPAPRWGDILYLMTELHSLIEKFWRAAKKPDYEQHRPLPRLETLDEMALRDEREHAAHNIPADRDRSR